MRLSRQDVRLAVRSIVRRPGFAVVALLSLALAIALNTTMYSVLDAMIRPNLNIRQPERYYGLQLFGDENNKVGARERYELLRSGGRTYDALLTQSPSTSTQSVEFENHYAQPNVVWLSPNALSTYGVSPRRGRPFAQTDLGAEVVPVMISERLASTLSPGREFPLGADIYLSGERHPVIGVLRRGDVFGATRPDVFLLDQDTLSSNIIRLREGARIEDLVAELKTITTRIAQMIGGDPRYVEYRLRPESESQFKPMRFHFALVAAVVAVLLVACANLANLQLARGIGRSREMALRTALGATRRDIITQLLLESALIALAGMLLGILLTWWGVHFLDARVPPAIADYVIEPQINWRIFVFAMATSGLCVLLIGLLPAIHVSRVDPNELLKSGAGTGANRSNRRKYGIMVIAEIAFSLALLSGAALVMRTAAHVRAINIGFDPAPVSVMGLFMRYDRDTAFRTDAYAAEIAAHLRHIPDVSDVAFAGLTHARGGAVTVNERDGTSHEVLAPMYGFAVVNAAYFRVLRLPIVKGRNFLDGAYNVSEAIIDQHTARNLWPGVDPIGQLIKLGEYKSDAPWVRVVGVAKDIADYRQLQIYGYDAKPSKVGSVYIALTTADSLRAGPKFGSYVRFFVRSETEPQHMVAELERAIPKGGVVRFGSAASMEEELGIRVQRQRHDFVASVFVTFAILAMALAALGIYAIVAHSVAERTRELGVRLALGASARDILHAVLREGNVVALAGVAFGLLMTKYTAGWLRAFIFEDDEYNAPVFAAMAAILFIVAVASALWPAMRATRIDPVESLRAE